MDEKKQDMIQKILKLLELGDADKKSNPHERELAQKKAAQMMAEHSLSFADLREGWTTIITKAELMDIESICLVR